MAKLTRLGATFFVGILSGMLLEEVSFFSYVARDLPAEHLLKLHTRFGALHPYTLIPLAGVAVALLVATAAIDRDARTWRGRATLLAAVIGVAVFALTVAAIMPMHFAIDAWLRDGIPANWQAVIARRTLLQSLRAAGVVTAFALMVSTRWTRSAHRLT